MLAAKFFEQLGVLLPDRVVRRGVREWRLRRRAQARPELGVNEREAIELAPLTQYVIDMPHRDHRVRRQCIGGGKQLAEHAQGAIGVLFLQQRRR